MYPRCYHISHTVQHIHYRPINTSRYINFVRIKETKSINTTFIFKLHQPPSVSTKNGIVLYWCIVIYLELYFDKKKLNWTKHIHITKLFLNRRLSVLHNIKDKMSKLNLKFKINLCYILIKLIWTYGIQLWN